MMKAWDLNTSMNDGIMCDSKDLKQGGYCCGCWNMCYRDDYF